MIIYVISSLVVINIYWYQYSNMYIIEFVCKQPYLFFFPFSARTHSLQSEWVTHWKSARSQTRRRRARPWAELLPRDTARLLSSMSLQNVMLDCVLVIYDMCMCVVCICSPLICLTIFRYFSLQI